MLPFTDPDIELSMFTLPFIFVLVCGLFEVNLCKLFVYICIVNEFKGGGSY